MSIELLRPIPDYTAARALEGYREYPIDPGHPSYAEPLVRLADYGVTGLSYYSQPNKTTGDPVPGATSDIYVRRSLAEKLGAVNEFLLSSSAITKLIGRKGRGVELNAREGFRSVEVQAYAHQVGVPARIRREYPLWSEAEVLAYRDKMIANPTVNATTLPPHYSGGAFDVSLQYQGTDEQVKTGYGLPQFGPTAPYPDFLEPLDEADAAFIGLTGDAYRLALNARRILHNLMTTDEVGGIALVSNPREIWHYSVGDQMWAQLTGADAAYYGYPPEIPDALKTDFVAMA